VTHTLLLADDSVTIQRVIELTFADEDVRVVAVSDGEEAIAMLDKAPPDIVLADVGMPGQNGYEVARHIKDTPRLSHIPIVLLTGAFEPVDQAKVTEVGCDGVLAKPFEPQLVIARVKELLARQKDIKGANGTGHERALERPKEPEPATDAEQGDDMRPVALESWGRPLEEGPPSDSASHAAAVADIDNYFDRLDAALTKHHKAARTDADDGLADLPLSSSEPETLAPDAHESQPPAPVLREVPRRPIEIPQPTPSQATGPQMMFPQLADAFAALLAAEQSGPSPATIPTWPVTTATEAPPASVSTPVADDIVEQVTRSVLDRLSDRIVREVVTEVVTSTAERLVKEELERLRRRVE
jgi:CheY-like chemotaxis protein